ncbi:uridine kinase [Candidatus Vecturithrix granuli]|uniref:Uridine kinase n=1 Tax=Vecturithrix granuli TaxID=1499967 RepID=A0A081C2S9_VECG1|nr:uridine kinase [Candidatus Vecturithrix granuli]
MIFTLNLAGQRWEVHIAQDELETVHLPLLKEITQKAELQAGRYLVALAGPPGSGKTTLGALWETLAREYQPGIPVQCLPMDGFHLPNTELDRRRIVRNGETIPLRKIKGAPESYDLKAIKQAFHAVRMGKELAWPKYDRQIHDPIANAIPVLNAGIIFIEGNYLLLDEPDWQEFHNYTDLSIFVECPEAVARERLLARQQRGGRAYQAAVQHYEFNDLPNWQRVMRHRLPGNAILTMNEDGRLGRI